MTVLVTGATGFVGGRLATRLLQQGNRVVALCRDGDPPKGCEVVRGDIEDLHTCERAMVEYEPTRIYHLAAQAIVRHAKRDPYATMETNIRGTYSMLEAYRRHYPGPSSMVVASSDKAYGELDVGSKYTEDTRLHGRGPYDVSKSCADLIAQSYAREYSLPIGIVRAGNIYGPGDTDMTRIIPSAVAAIRNWKSPEILSDGTPVRDYIWIDDVVDGYLKVADHAAVHDMCQFNLSGGEPISVSRLIQLLIEVSDNRVGMPVPADVRRSEIHYQVLDTSLARKVLGWAPKVTLRDGLWRTFWGQYESQY